MTQNEPQAAPPAAFPTPPHAVPSAWKAADRVLRDAERNVGLLLRCTPSNAASEQQRLVQCLRVGRPELPRWTYATPPHLGATQGLLAELAEHLPQDPVSRLYAARAQEQELECRLVQSLGQPPFASLAAQRFSSVSATAERWALRLAQRWVRLPEPPPEATSVSDDATDARSLYRSLCRAVGELRLPVNVQCSASLSAAAATGDGLILVARGRALTESAVRRIVLHEVLGHALPRVKARQHALGLLSVGSRAGDDTQEGYALLLEQEHAVMDSARKRELALRHLAAVAVRAGADWVQTVQHLQEQSAELLSAAAIASRAHRGGGLARELVYLPAWYQVRKTLRQQPALRSALALGRLSVEAVLTLRQCAWL